MHAPFRQGLICALAQSDLARADELRGFAEEEIHRAEQLSGLRFPAVYRDFLRTCGKSAGRFFKGSHVAAETPERLLEFRDWAEDLLKESSGGLALSSSQFVFLVHQGYEFTFFVADGDDDPAVFEFIEGDRRFSQVSARLSGFFFASISLQTKAIRSRGPF